MKLQALTVSLFLIIEHRDSGQVNVAGSRGAVVFALVGDAVALVVRLHHVLPSVGDVGEGAAAPDADIGDSEGSQGGPHSVARFVGSAHVVVEGALAVPHSSTRDSLVAMGQIKKTPSPKISRGSGRGAAQGGGT